MLFPIVCIRLTLVPMEDHDTRFFFVWVGKADCRYRVIILGPIMRKTKHYRRTIMSMQLALNYYLNPHLYYFHIATLHLFTAQEGSRCPCR